MTGGVEQSAVRFGRRLAAYGSAGVQAVFLWFRGGAASTRWARGERGGASRGRLEPQVAARECLLSLGFRPTGPGPARGVYTAAGRRGLARWARCRLGLGLGGHGRRAARERMYRAARAGALAGAGSRRRVGRRGAVGPGSPALAEARGAGAGPRRGSEEKKRKKRDVFLF